MTTPRKLKTPDVTPAQVVAIAGSLVGVAVAFGAPISDVQADRLLDVVKVVAGVLLGADTIIRAARAKYLS